MPEGNTDASLNFAPTEDDSGGNSSTSEDNEQGCHPSKIFQRHRSLAELTCIAVSEKQTLDGENSQTSDISEASSSKYLGRENYKCNSSGSAINTIEACHVGQTKTVPLTPTKIAQAEGLNNDDPLTPTANLKMLMSVVSPAIRDREEKKKDLFYADGVENVVEEVIIEKPTVYSRKDKSLGLLCQRFLAKFPEDPGDNPTEICLDEVSRDLKVERRRVYDIVNVLESVEVLSRLAKNRYLWHGKTRITQTLGRLKVLSRSQDFVASKKKGKENPSHANTLKAKMKRHFSCGDLPKKKNFGTASDNQKNLTKEEERLRIKAAIDSTDHCRKDKSLGVLSQKFLIMFLLSKGGVVTLEDAANVLLEEQDEGNVKYKTKVRRLYDIANILSSLRLIEKVHIRGASGKKPGFKWIGVDIDSLPENAIPTGPVLTFKTKHSLLPEPTGFVDTKGPSGQSLLLPSTAIAGTAAQNSTPGTVEGNPVDPKVRWSKSASCIASLSGTGGKSESDGAGAADGFLVHEFASSPVNLLGRDVTLYSPTDITFREEILKLREKFPNRMSQLLPVLPFSPSYPGNGNKTSRRNLFNKTKTRSPSAEMPQPNPKRLRTNSAEDSTNTQSNMPASINVGATGTEEPCQLSDENNDNNNPEKLDSQSKFMHSTNSPFKVMTSCSHQPTNDCRYNTIAAGHNGHTSDFNYNQNQILQERQKQQVLLQEQHQIQQMIEPQWRHMVGQLRSQETGSSPRVVQLVDQAVSPIPPSKLLPGRSSIAVQASLIKDVSPLKPLVFLHRRIPSPWKQPGGSPSCVPPAPPSTPELPNELAVGPFQSQANKVYLRSVSPYPVSGSQSCGSSPVAPFTGAKLFFPPSPSTPTGSMNNLVIPQGSLLYNVNQIMSTANTNMTPPPGNHHSNSCPPSVNPSPIPMDSGAAFGSGVVLPRTQTLNPVVNVSTPMTMSQQTPEQYFSRPDTVFPSSQAQNFTPCQHKQPSAVHPGVKHPCMMINNAGGLSETPSYNVDDAIKDNVSRKLRLANE